MIGLIDLREEFDYRLFLSHRHTNTEQRLKQSIHNAIKATGIDILDFTYNSTIVKSSDFPELSIVDYLLWALQRYILIDEGRYFMAMTKYYEKILDLYEDEAKVRIYDADNPFDVSKARYV